MWPDVACTVSFFSMPMPYFLRWDPPSEDRGLPYFQLHDRATDRLS